jgi:very-short-patch-repair endonuclease
MITPPSQRIPEPKVRDVARSLRRNSTIPERLLWGVLRSRRLTGLKFRRQLPIVPYFADFGCEQIKLVIELDGMTHVGAGKRDDKRTAFIESQGYKLIRFTDDDVLQNLEAVALEIERIALNRIHPKVPSPQPSPGRRCAAGRGGRMP